MPLIVNEIWNGRVAENLMLNIHTLAVVGSFNVHPIKSVKIV